MANRNEITTHPTHRGSTKRDSYNYWLRSAQFARMDGRRDRHAEALWWMGVIRWSIQYEGK